VELAIIPMHFIKLETMAVLTRYTLWIFLLSVLGTAYIAVAEPDARSYVTDLEETPIPEKGYLRWNSEDHDLYAEVEGQIYLITQPEWNDVYKYKSIIFSQDLDGDGLNEAVASLNHGGNCCPIEYALVSYRGDGFFGVSTLPEFASWIEPVLIDLRERPTIKVLSPKDGYDNATIDENLLYFTVEYGALKLQSTLSNGGLLFAIIRRSERWSGAGVTNFMKKEN
jgi:hypothetical protein